MVTYGKVYAWRDFYGGRHSVTSTQHHSPEEAEKKARALAIAVGWKPPKWWQFWRWADYPRK